jgi:hypothetical protein
VKSWRPNVTRDIRIKQQWGIVLLIVRFVLAAIKGIIPPDLLLIATHPAFSNQRVTGIGDKHSTSAW